MIDFKKFERVPIRWNPLIDTNSLRIDKSEHLLISDTSDYPMYR